MMQRTTRGRPRAPFSRSKLFSFCGQVGLKEVEDILRDVDLNGDGLVDFEGKTPQKSRAVLTS